MSFNRYFGLITGISVFLSIFGFWARITHQSYADKVFAAGMWSLAVCMAVYVYIKLSPPKNKG